MAGEKRFRGAFFGFNKLDVNSVIATMLKEFEGKLIVKDEEIAVTKSQHRDVKIKYDELFNKYDVVNAEKDKIADALIRAQEKADSIIEEARAEAANEKNMLEEQVENKKEELVDLNNQVKKLKTEVITTLKKYEGQLNVIVNIEDEIQLNETVIPEDEN